MKQLFLLITIFACTISSYADPHEDITEAEADSLIARFDKTPYILSFCDCCDMDYGSLIKIENVEKIACSYNENYISLKVTGQHIANIGLSGSEVGNIEFMEVGTEMTEIIALNYTWGFENGLAVPLGYLEYLELSSSCDEFANIPYSDENETYLAFYNEWIKPYIITEVKTTTKRLNLRDENSITSNVVSTVKKGTTCKVIKRSSHPHKVETYYDFWYYVELPNGKKGWLLGEFTDANIDVGGRLRIVGEHVNVRSEPNLNGKVLTQINGSDNKIYKMKSMTDDLYHIDGIGDYWYKIKVGRKEGWVYGQLTSVARFLPD